MAGGGGIGSPSSTHHHFAIEADDGGMVALDKLPWPPWLAKEGRDGGINGTAKRGHVIPRLSRIGWYFEKGEVWSCFCIFGRVNSAGWRKEEKERNWASISSWNQVREPSNGN